MKEHLQEQHLQEQHLQEQHLQEQHLQEQHLQEQHLQEQHLQEQHLQEQHLQEQHLQEQHLQEQHLQEQHLQEQHLQEQHLQEQHLQEQHLQEQHLQEQHLQEQHLQEHLQEQHLQEQHLQEQHLQEQHLQEQQLQEQHLQEHLQEQHLQEQHLQEQQLPKQHLQEHLQEHLRLSRRDSFRGSRVCGQRDLQGRRYSNRLNTRSCEQEDEEEEETETRRHEGIWQQNAGGGVKRSDQQQKKNNRKQQQFQVLAVPEADMSPAAGVLLLLNCGVLLVLVVPPCAGQGSDCSCNVTNSRCDKSGLCRCDPGWDGERCERCVPMPGCLHGSCQQPWQCSCELGWGGRFCDKDLSVCSEQQPCRYGATCVMEDSGDHTCLCPEGFHGRNCELKSGPCHRRRSPCRNGGLCEDAGGFAAELTCRCLAGFTGPRCETDVDDCLMRPCANGATCLDAVNRFSCVCPAGFTGRFCTVNLDDCASRPCLHAGRCLDRAGSFHCVCRPGYTGATCETPLRSPETGWTTLGWEGGEGGGVRPHQTTGGKNQRISTSSGNSSRHGDRLFKVTLSERGAAGLSEVQLIILLVLAGMTLAVVALTATLVLQRRCRDWGHAPCWVMTSSSQQRGQKSGRRAQQDEQDRQISLLNVAEAEKKKLNTEVI